MMRWEVDPQHFLSSPARGGNSGLTLQHAQRFVDFRLQLLLRLEQHEQLTVIHLEHHAGDLACELWLMLRNLRVELLTDHLLLHTWWCCRQIGSIQWLSWTSRSGLSGHCLLRRAHLSLRPALAATTTGRHRTLLHLLRHHRAHHAHLSHVRWHPHHWHTTRTSFVATWRHAALASHHHLLWIHHCSTLSTHLRRHAHHLSWHTTFAHHSAHWAHHSPHGVHHRPRHAHHSAHLVLHATTAIHLRRHAATWTHHASSLASLAFATHTRRIALPQSLLPGFTLFCQADIQRLALDNLQVHLSHSLGGFIRG
mmetsp:Transcript_87759/g.160532  ORF Transcript_87759/g.160532 Transcript_87759/m.160532 type:complete len:310 (-) Transcript_87759:1181-2110(-)